MNKCDCWHKEERIVGWCGFSPLTKTVYECYGTKEREECHCMGDRSKCNFYPEEREEAKKDNGCEYCYTDCKFNPFVTGYNFCPMCGRDLRKD